jgi:UMF1 family MFS transporter
MTTYSKKVINGWTMYDWANSVYNLVITTTIFPAYYVAVTSDKDPATTDYVNFLGMRFINSSLYDYTFALAILIVAFLSPILSPLPITRETRKRS